MKHITEIQLIDYANSSIDEQQKSFIESHLAQCSLCREQFEQTNIVFEALENFAVPQTVDLKLRVRQSVAASKAGFWKRIGFNMAKIAAVIVVSATLGLFAASSIYSNEQTYSISDLKTQAGISFFQPARHVAMAASGETR